jgi:hypothetical protein
MKLFYLAFLLACCTLSIQAQFSMSTGYGLGIPQQKMANNLNAVHQFKTSFLYRLPKNLQRISVGIDGGTGNYARLSMPITFNFGSGRPTTTYVDYNSNTTFANAILQVDFFQKTAFTPYAILTGGVQKWSSKIYIEDPTDLDGCRALENKTILKDRTATFGVGAGIKGDLSKLFNIRERGKHFFYISAVSTKGGEIDYINTRKLKEHNHDPNTPLSEGAKALNMRFINVQSNVIHNHMMAEVFTTPLRLLEFNIGYTFRF